MKLLREILYPLIAVIAAFIVCFTGMASAQVSDGPPPAVRLPIPDVTIYDQDDKQLKFYTDLVKRRTVFINFTYTEDTTIGPPLMATMRRVQKDLAERAECGIQLVTVSVNPRVDTPEKLKAYAAKFGAGPGWSFVTGKPEAIAELLKALGAYAPRLEDTTPMVLIGNDAANYWTRTYGLSSPTALVEVICAAASKSGP